jgi:hypothetical protein
MQIAEEKRGGRKNKSMMVWVVTVGIILVAVAIEFWYSRVSNDLSPDSLLGFAFAISGTIFLLLAAIRYSMHRRSRTNGSGLLNKSLHWHIGFAMIAFALLLLHSFGNFNPRSGTYALFAMIAMVVSGVIGKALDKVMPLLITREVSKALTAQGDDRLEEITQQLHTMVEYSTQELQGFSVAQKKDSSRLPIKPQSNEPLLPLTQRVEQANARAQLAPTLQTSWDLAYISLEELPQEIQHDAAQYRFVPDPKSKFELPKTLVPGMDDQLSEIKRVEQALQREQLFRFIIRYWRILHVCLAVLTVGLTIWHIEFALSLLIPVWLHH